MSISSALETSVKASSRGYTQLAQGIYQCSFETLLLDVSTCTKINISQSFEQLSKYFRMNLRSSYERTEILVRLRHNSYIDNHPDIVTTLLFPR